MNDPNPKDIEQQFRDAPRIDGAGRAVDRQGGDNWGVNRPDAGGTEQVGGHNDRQVPAERLPTTGMEPKGKR